MERVRFPESFSTARLNAPPPAPGLSRVRGRRQPRAGGWLRPLLAVGLGVVLAGCGGPGLRAIDPGQYADDHARGLLERGQYRAAAKEYLRIAALAPDPVRQQLELAAASAYIAATNSGEARRVLDRMKVPAGGSASVRVRRSVLMARADLLDGHPGNAVKHLAPFRPDGLPSDLERELLTVQAQAFEAAHDPTTAASRRASLDVLLVDPSAVTKNRAALWADLQALNDLEIRSLADQPSRPVSPWAELASIGRRFAQDAEGMQPALELWTRHHPGHPGGDRFAKQMLEEAQAQGGIPGRIALLLPFTGPFGQVGQAIRDGFLAGWFSASPLVERPAIDIYDTGNDPVEKLYDKAIEAGADFVVGPLQKPAVTRVLSIRPGRPERVSLLALNAPDEPPGAVAQTAPSYRFALDPESEAEQVAEHAWQPGRVQAAILAPDSAWGKRVAEAFANRWTTQGGTVLAIERYSEDPEAISSSVRTLLGVDRSERRAARLRAVLGKQAKFEPRRRHDLDLVFLAGFPRQARQVRPQLDFYRASKVPVFSTSHVFSGAPNPNADGDINGVEFGDMPWVLDPKVDPLGLRETLFAEWPAAAGAFTRFYAFGIDAYRLTRTIGRLRSGSLTTLDGYTGILSIPERTLPVEGSLAKTGSTKLSGDSLRPVRRLLSWAIFVDGLPKLVESALE